MLLIPSYDIGNGPLISYNLIWFIIMQMPCVEVKYWVVAPSVPNRDQPLEPVKQRKDTPASPHPEAPVPSATFVVTPCKWLLGSL